MIKKERRKENYIIQGKEIIYRVIMSIGIFVVSFINCLGNKFSLFFNGSNCTSVNNAAIRFDMMSGILFVCFAVSVLPIIWKNKYELVSLFVSKLVPIICMIKLITNCFYMCADNNEIINQSIIVTANLSALGWIQIISSMMLLAFSVFCSIRKIRKDQ